MSTSAKGKGKRSYGASSARGPSQQAKRRPYAASSSSNGGGYPMYQRMSNLPPGVFPGKADTKHIDLALVNYDLNTTGSIALLATIPSGTSDTTRTDQDVCYKSVWARGFAATSGTSTTMFGRVLVIYDRQPTGALPAITDILTSANPHAFPNDTNRLRFKTLYQKDFALSSASTAAGNNMAAGDFYFKVPKQYCYAKFGTAGTGAIGDIATGALYLVTVGNIAAGTADGIAALSFRVRYSDRIF